MSRLVFHRPTAGDWTVVELDNRVIYEGHSSLNDMSHDILFALNIDYTVIEYSDEEFEEKF